MEALSIASKRGKSTLHKHLPHTRSVAEDIPNEGTIAAFEEAQRIRENPSTAKRYASFDELLQDVEMEMAQGVL